MFGNSQVSQVPEYLLNQILWGKIPVAEVINRIYEQISTVGLAKSTFYNFGFLISVIIVAIILLRKILNKNKKVYIEIICFIFFYLSPFLLTIIIGQAEAIRAQMPAIQFVIAFSYYYIYLHLDNKWLRKRF